MKWISLSIIFLFQFSCLSQSDERTAFIIDSLKQVIASTKSDSIKIESYRTWDNFIYIENPDLDLEINEKIVAIADRNIATPGLSRSEYKYYYKIKGISSNIIGLVLVDHGDYYSAHDLFQESLRIAEAVQDSTGMAGATNNLGMIYKHQGNPQKGFSYYEKAMSLDGENDDWSKAIYLNNMGLCYAELEKDQLALNLYRESLSLAKLTGNEQSEANTVGNIGEIFFALEQDDSAIHYFDLALVINVRIKNTVGYTYNLMRLGMTNLKMGNTQKAIEFCSKGLNLARSKNLLNNEMKCNSCLHKAYRELNNSKKALYHFEQYEWLKDSLLNQQEMDKITESQYMIEYEKKRLGDSLEISNQQRIKEVKLEADIQSSEKEQKFLYAGIGVLFLFGIFVYRNYRLKKKDNEIIAEQKEIVEEKNQEITDSITYARRIQEAILPPKKMLKEFLPKSFILYKPKDIVAGDFYWMEKIDDIIYIAVADCTGHGVPGAMVSVVCHNALNRAVREFVLRDTGQILDKTRELVIETFEKSEDRVKDGMDIAICLWNEKTHELQYSGAYNPLYLVQDGEGEKNLTEIKGDKQPIGMYDLQENFITHKLKLQTGDKIYTFTDGFADQFGGESGKKFKYKNFKHLITSTAHLSMDEQLTEIENSFVNWMGQLEQLDDVCVFGMEVNNSVK